MSKNQLTVCNTSIPQDAAGRYFLNALHKAAGNDPKDAPAQFFRNDKTTRLVELLTPDMQNCITDKINNLAPVNIVKGFNEEQGTYVVKPLVYAYAMWISPEFHLHVINAYDALVTGQINDLLKPITAPITESEFSLRQKQINEFHAAALDNLANAEVMTTVKGSQFMRKPGEADHSGLQAALEMAFSGKAKPKRPRAVKPRTCGRWTEEEKQLLLELFAQGLKDWEVAQRLNKDASSVLAMYGHLKRGMRNVH